MIESLQIYKNVAMYYFKLITDISTPSLGELSTRQVMVLLMS